MERERNAKTHLIGCGEEQSVLKISNEVQKRTARKNRGNSLKNIEILGDKIDSTGFFSIGPMRLRKKSAISAARLEAVCLSIVDYAC